MRELGAGTEVGGYRIEAVIGRGGMGVVYRAVQRRPERTVAVKVIAPELADRDDFRARFERESNLAARIEHPNVIPVYEVGDDRGLLYIAMRYVEGTDLRALVADEGRLAPTRAARIVSQVASALDAAHRRGLVHRDVKPANVLIGRGEGEEEHAYLTDFGLVKLVEAETSGMTATGAFIGTLDYVAPEQLEGDVNARSDVYALGCLLYNALTGVPPYPHPTPAAKVWAHLNAPPPSVSAAAPGVAHDFDIAVARAMAKRPEDRYPSAGDLGRAALAAATGKSPPAAHTEPTVTSRDAGFSTTGFADSRISSQSPAQPGKRRLPRGAWVAGALALVLISAALAVFLIGSGENDEPTADRGGTDTAGGQATPTTPQTRDQKRPEVGSRVELKPVGDANASGFAAFVLDGGKETLAIRAAVPPIPEEEAYEVWLYNSRYDAVSVGAQQPNRAGEFEGAGRVPEDFEQYLYIDISLESKVTAQDRHSGRSLLRARIGDFRVP